MTEVERLAIAAKTDENSLTDLVNGHKQWILRCATDAAGHYVTESDDEWSIALLAFTEAVRSFDEEKGSFPAFARTVIRRRLTDHFRSQSRYRAEITVLPGAFEGELSEDEVNGVTLQVERQVAAQSAESVAAQAREEIQEVKEILQGYGFTFPELAECSPKAEKTKAHCAKAVRALLGSDELKGETRRTKKLPMKELSKVSGVPKKILDRHRKYILAAMEILEGDFPIMAEYLDFIRREAGDGT